MGLDTVEILMAWESSFGIEIADAEAEQLLTPKMAMDLIASKLSLAEKPKNPCLSMRAFHRLRQSFISAAGVHRSQVRPDTDLRDLLEGKPRKTWAAVRDFSGVSLPRPGWGRPKTVGKLVHWAVAHGASKLKHPNELWTRAEIRSVVRAAVTVVTGKDGFPDDALFIKEIGLDR